MSRPIDDVELHGSAGSKPVLLFAHSRKKLHNFSFISVMIYRNIAYCKGRRYGNVSCPACGRVDVLTSPSRPKSSIFRKSEPAPMKKMVDHRFSRKRFVAADQPLGSATPTTQCVRSLRFGMHCRPQPIQRHLLLVYAMLRQAVEQSIGARLSPGDFVRPKRLKRSITASRFRFDCAPARSPVHAFLACQACARCIRDASSHHLPVSNKHSSMPSALPVVTLTETPS